MAKARCPECDTLVGISPTPHHLQEGWSARWWKVDVHKHPTKPSLCEGGGKHV